MSPFALLLALAMTATSDPAHVKRPLSVEVDGETRAFTAYVPVELPAGKVSVVFNFHHAWINGQTWANRNEMHEAPGAENFIFVYPDAIDGLWNGGTCCGLAVMRDYDDLGFVEAMLDELESFAQISPDRNFVTGFSNGAIMAQQVACKLPDRIAAVATVGGHRDPTAGCDAAGISMLHMHGLRDRQWPYEGGFVRGQDRVPTPNVMAWWLERQDCPSWGTEVSIINEPAIRYNCRNGTEVTFVALPKIGHVWPGPRATDEVVEFFARTLE